VKPEECPEPESVVQQDDLVDADIDLDELTQFMTDETPAKKQPVEKPERVQEVE